jgi:inorganic pyrophosphatase
MSRCLPDPVPRTPLRSLRVRIEVPRFGFLKRGSSGKLDFVSPLPCPFNYGSVPHLIGLEGDLLDAVVLGPRLPAGSVVEVPVWGAVGLSDRGLYDDKLICAARRPEPAQWRLVAGFFSLYGRCKRLLNLYRGQPGLTRSEGFVDPAMAIARCAPRDRHWRGPRVDF